MLRYFTKRQWQKVKHMYEGCETIELKIGVVANLDKPKEPGGEEEKIRQEKKKAKN